MSNTLQMTLTGICEKIRNAQNKTPTADHSLAAFKHSRFNFLKSQWYKCGGSQNVCSFETFLWSSTDDQDHLGLQVFWFKAMERPYIIAFTSGGKTCDIGCLPPSLQHSNWRGRAWRGWGKTEHRLASKMVVNPLNYRVIKYKYKRRFTTSNIRWTMLTDLFTDCWLVKPKCVESTQQWHVHRNWF
jgi:hypothetical protein